ncbi:MAG TPA: hypothetical protein VFZ66_13560 [Herpetosiphonaceae bacterium]
MRHGRSRCLFVLVLGFALAFGTGPSAQAARPAPAPGGPTFQPLDVGCEIIASDPYRWGSLVRGRATVTCAQTSAWIEVTVTISGASGDATITNVCSNTTTCTAIADISYSPGSWTTYGEGSGLSSWSETDTSNTVEL